MIDPAAESVEARDDSCDHCTFEFSDDKQLGLGGKFTADHELRVVPRGVIAKDVTPQGGDARLIAGLVGANDEIVVGHE
jgi:hypothetical protein